jgi:hypothetical protein
MTSENPEAYTRPLTFYETLEARMQFDPALLNEMLGYNTELLARATDPTEIAELIASDQNLRELLLRLEF